MGFLNIIIIAAYIFLSVGGLVLFKYGSFKKLDISFLNGVLGIDVNIFVIVGILCYMLSFLLYLFLVSKFNLSYIVPITIGLVYILTILSSVLFFKENMHFYHVIGIVLIIIGVFLINLKR